MTTIIDTTNRILQDEPRFALCRGVKYWAVVFQGREAVFKHELGALYVTYLLLHPTPEGLHAVALALKARDGAGRAAGPDEVVEERSMGLEDAASVRALWRQQRDLERVLADRLEIEPVKAEALRELEEITHYLRQSPWLSWHGAERCVRAVAIAIKRFHTHLAGAVDADGKPDEVLRAFALHLYEHLLIPSGRSGSGREASVPTGCFTYEPPRGVVWTSGESPAPSGARESRRPAAVAFLSRFLCLGFALGLLATSGCAGTRPLRGGKAVTTHKPAGIIEQTLVQSENPSQATKQDQESVKVRTFTVPAGSRIEPPQVPVVTATQPVPVSHESQPSTSFLISAPMPVIEREETHARTELGAAQKDTARELGAKLSSLKGIVILGGVVFLTGLLSVIWPPAKAIVGSVTTSAALMLGGLALVILPSLVVGNELLILGGVAVAVGGWFLAHRHGQLRGIIAASGGDQKTASNP